MEVEVTRNGKKVLIKIEELTKGEKFIMDGDLYLSLTTPFPNSSVSGGWGVSCLKIKGEK